MYHAMVSREKGEFPAERESFRKSKGPIPLTFMASPVGDDLSPMVTPKSGRTEWVRARKKTKMTILFYFILFGLVVYNIAFCT